MIRENGVIIGWHPIDKPESTTTLRVGRWSALVGLLTGRLTFEVTIARDERYVADLLTAAAEGGGTDR